MPHIVVEHSSILETPMRESGLLPALHRAVVDSGLFSPEAVKARSVAYDDVVLPEGAANFVHITVSILSGRSEEQRAALAGDLFTLAQKTLPVADKLSVDIREMCAETYRK